MTNNEIKVQYGAGVSRNKMVGSELASIDYMLATVIVDDEEIELYAEVVTYDADDPDCEDVDIDAYIDAFGEGNIYFEAEGFEILKAEIIQQAIVAGIDPERLVF